MKRSYEGINSGGSKVTPVEVILSTQPGGRVYNSPDFLRKLSTKIARKLDAGQPCDFSRILPHPETWELLAHFLRTGQIRDLDPSTNVVCVILNAQSLGMTQVMNFIKAKIDDPKFCIAFSDQHNIDLIGADLMLQLVDGRPLSCGSKLTPLGLVVKKWSSKSRGNSGPVMQLLASALADINTMEWSYVMLQVKGSHISGVDGKYQELPCRRNGKKAWKRVPDYTRDSGLTHLANMRCPPCIYFNSDAGTWCLEWDKEGYFVKENVGCPSEITRVWTFKKKGARKGGELKPMLNISKISDEKNGSCLIA